MVLLMTLFFLVCHMAYGQSKNIKPEKENRAENTEGADVGCQNVDLPESDSLEEWLGYYEQSGTLWGEIYGGFDLYIYRENGTYYGYLCVSGGETGRSCYFDERILTEIRGSQDMIQVIFLERQELKQGCYHEEYPDIFTAECGESTLDEAIRTYEYQDVLFSLKRDGDVCTVIEESMLLGKSQEGIVNDFDQCSELLMDYICDEDKAIFLKMFREKEHLSENQQPDYSSYTDDGELIVNLYLNTEQESGTGIYYGETQVSKYITQFDINSWQQEIWEDNKYSLIRKGEEAAAALEEYQEYKDYNDQGKITSFYSEGIITGWGEPQKEKLVQIEFSYRADGTLERKSCHYNHRLYGTTRQSETFYFDTQERLTYSTAYVTYGMLSDYYFYEEDKEKPVYCLNLDHMGHSCIGTLIRYDNSCPDKYAEFFVYKYKNNILGCLGTVNTISSSSLRLDGKGGLLGYLYEAGQGGTHRYYMDKVVLYNDDEADGYYFGSEGNFTEWFRGGDGSKAIVTEGTSSEYESI